MARREPPHGPMTAPMSAVGIPPTDALLLVAGEGHVSTHELDGRPLVIGRGDDADIRIDHKALSRRHAVVDPGPPITVRDLGSTNGTRIGGALRKGGEASPLGASESFHIGPFSFVLVGRGAKEPRSASGKSALRVLDPTPAGVPSLIKQIAASDASVLVLAETGAGKEVLADTIHQLSGRTGAFTRINCAALSESLLESELFGHEKGAFTGAATSKPGLLEAAAGGTVFLDEVGELPLTIQAKLLRAVEHREVLRLGSVKPHTIDVRFVAATNRDLPAEVAAGRFRRDLFFRLDGVTIAIPPLRERRDRIGALALGFLEGARRDGPAPRLSAEALAALEAHPWPGNVRELKAVVERAVLLARGGEIGVRHLSFARSPSSPAEGEAATLPAMTALTVPPLGAPASPADAGLLDDEQRADRDRVIAALEECAGNQTRAAKMLGIGRTSLVQKLRLYRIPRPRA